MNEFKNLSLSSGDDKASFPTTKITSSEEAAKTRRSTAENAYQELVNEYNETVQEKKLDESRNHALGKESCDDKAYRSVIEKVHKEIFNEYSKDLQEKKKTNRTSGDDKASFPTTEIKSSEEATKTIRSVMEGWHDKFLKDC